MNSSPLTLIPFDRRLIDAALLNKQECDWLNDYHKCVYDAAAEHLENDEKLWLAAICAAH